MERRWLITNYLCLGQHRKTLNIEIPGSCWMSGKNIKARKFIFFMLLTLGLKHYRKIEI